MPGPRRRDGGVRRGAVVALAVLLLAFAMARAAVAQTEADVYVARAIVAYNEKRYEDALAALEQALALDPDHVDALYYAGLVHIASGRFDRAVATLERARSRAPADQGVLFELGIAYLSLGKYDEARPFLERVFAENPSIEGLGYYVGLLRYQRADYEGAVQAFRQSVSADAKIQQLTSLYTGLALASLGLRERAIPEIEQAARLLSASPLTGPAERLRNAIGAAPAVRRRFRAEVRVGGFYDDNVPVNPDLGTDPFVQQLRRREKESPGEIGSLRVEYSFLQSRALEAAVTASVFATHNHDLPDFDLTDYLAGVSAAYRGTVASLPYQVFVLYTYDFLTLGGDEFARRHTVTPFATLVEDRHNVTALQAQYQRKDFAEAVNTARADVRDGTNWMVGVLHFLRFEGDRHLLKVGYQWDVDDTFGRNFRYRGHRFLAGGQYTVPWANLRLNYDFDAHLREYQYRNTTLPSDAPNTRRRSDEEFTHLASLTLPLPWNVALTAQYQRTQAQSNLDAFTYSRNVFSLFLTWSY